MKIPEWLPDSQRPVGPEQQPRNTLIEPWVRPLVQFMHIEAAGGFVLLACTALALVLANSPWSARFAEVWQTRVGFTIGAFELYKPLLLWINDGLMTVFFFVVGLEIKREIVFGELKDLRKAILPAAAALGGMLAPAAIYLGVQGGVPGGNGWGIPMATDIAFVVGFLAVLGSRIPFGLKILLLTLAIVDDIGAILVIAVAYTADTSLAFLGIGMASFGLVYLFRWIGVRPVPVYLCLGTGVWLAFLKSGVHPTVAGVVLGLLTPASPWFAGRSLVNVAEGVALRLGQDGDADAKHRVVSASLRHAGFFCEQGRATAGRVAEWGSHAEAFHWRAGGVRSANARRTPVAARRMREMGCGDASWREERLNARQLPQIVPRHPVGRRCGHAFVMTLQLRQVIERINLRMLAGVDQAHVRVAHLRPAFRLIKK